VTANGVLREVPIIAGVAAGPSLPEQWDVRAEPVDYFDVRGDLEALFAATGATPGIRADVPPRCGQSAACGAATGRSAGWGALPTRIAS
jgi:phenylalanyl-tRNA synthetase beta chain